MGVSLWWIIEGISLSFVFYSVDALVCVCVCVQSLCFRMQKMLEVYRPDWCEAREDWSVFLFSPQNK